MSIKQPRCKVEASYIFESDRMGQSVEFDIDDSLPITEFNERIAYNAYNLVHTLWSRDGIDPVNTTLTITFS